MGEGVYPFGWYRAEISIISSYIVEETALRARPMIQKRPVMVDGTSINCDRTVTNYLQGDVENSLRCAYRLSGHRTNGHSCKPAWMYKDWHPFTTSILSYMHHDTQSYTYGNGAQRSPPPPKITETRQLTYFCITVHDTIGVLHRKNWSTGWVSLFCNRVTINVSKLIRTWFGISARQQKHVGASCAHFT